MTHITEVDVAIIGAGTAGLNALRQVKDAGKSFVLIERGELGTMCARTGCIPSKAVLHASEVMGYWVEAEAEGEANAGTPSRRVTDKANRLWRLARATRDRSAEGMAKETLELAGDKLIRGAAHVINANDIQVGDRVIRARATVIATGSAPFVPDQWKALGTEILTTDSLFDLDTLPSTMGLIGLGAIGLEMGVALSRLGVHVTAADQADVVGGIGDPLIAQVARQHVEREMTMWLGEPVDLERNAAGGFAMVSGGPTQRRAEVERVLVALGRRSSLPQLDLQNAGVEVDEHGNVPFDPQTMRIGESNFYLAGDVANARPLQHEAADEGSIAGWNAARHESNDSFRRRVPLSIAFTNPDFAATGCAFDKLPAGTLIAEGCAHGNARSGITDQNDNVVRLYVEPDSGRLLGAALFSGAGEHLAHLLAWAVQRGETVEELLRLPFYHPTVEEMLQTALHDAAAKLQLPHRLDLEPAGHQ
jgi:dihydrolipoamide dehydrogenase